MFVFLFQCGSIGGVFLFSVEGGQSRVAGVLLLKCCCLLLGLLLVIVLLPLLRFREHARNCCLLASRHDVHVLTVRASVLFFYTSVFFSCLTLYVLL